MTKGLKLSGIASVLGTPSSRMTEWWTTRSIAAAVAMGLAKMRSHSEKTRFDVDAQRYLLGADGKRADDHEAGGQRSIMAGPPTVF